VYTRLKKSPVHFVGNVEGGDLFSGNVDVIVSDGFVGNIALKICEGLAFQISGLLRKSHGQLAAFAGGGMLSKGAFKALRKTIELHGVRRSAALGRARRLRHRGHGRSNANAGENRHSRGRGAGARAHERKNRTGAFGRRGSWHDGARKGLTMGKVAFVFPGQASQYPGMGRELAEKYPAARAVFDEADEALGLSISKICFEGTEEELKLTANTSRRL